MQALCPEQPNLCAVGDADQAIYGFRGAQVDIFLRFQADFPGAAVLRLEDNYRSSATILAAAQAVIENNSRRIEKTLQPLRPAGAPLEMWDAATDQDEAAFVSREIERLMGGMRFESLGHDGDDCVKGFGDIAVLYRLHQQGRLLKKALQSRGIPVDMAATRSVFEEPSDLKPCWSAASDEADCQLPAGARRAPAAWLAASRILPPAPAQQPAAAADLALYPRGRRAAP